MDFILAIASLGVNIYIFMNIDGISARAGLVSEMDIIMGAITIVLVLEAARRCVGYELSALAVIFMAYAYLGPYLPGPLMHRGYSFQRLVDHMYISAEGIY